MNPRSTDCEADALTTTPSRRLSTPWTSHFQRLCVVPFLIWNVYSLVSGTPRRVHHLFDSKQATVSSIRDLLTAFRELLMHMRL